MPEYVYRCPNGHEVIVVHGMLEDPRTWCAKCGAIMNRKPGLPNVLWSRFIEPSAAVKHHLAHLEEKREDNARKYGN
jgi:hypothetical protein